MPPKIKVTKEDIIRTSVELVRRSGEQAINARTLAALLNCSTQPIFSMCVVEELSMYVRPERSCFHDPLSNSYAVEVSD